MDLVVLVGGGDNVDNPSQAALEPYMRGIQPGSSAYLRTGALKLSERSCGENENKMGANLSRFGSLHILG